MCDPELLVPLLPLAESQEYSLSPQHPTSAAYAGIMCGKQASTLATERNYFKWINRMAGICKKDGSKEEEELKLPVN